jgi:hypothetical protein
VVCMQAGTNKYASALLPSHAPHLAQVSAQSYLT